ncbi:pyridoxal-phosphate dependent enzyme, partial [Mycobacterium marseillense]
MTEVRSFSDTCLHSLATPKILEPRECGQLAPATSRRPAALVGNTPVLRVSAPLSPPGRGFWAKLEGFNPGGSMKDRPALHMVEAARARGELTPGARIVESTSGSLGLGLALAGQAY